MSMLSSLFALLLIPVVQTQLVSSGPNPTATKQTSTKSASPSQVQRDLLQFLCWPTILN